MTWLWRLIRRLFGCRAGKVVSAKHELVTAQLNALRAAGWNVLGRYLRPGFTDRFGEMQIQHGADPELRYRGAFPVPADVLAAMVADGERASR